MSDSEKIEYFPSPAGYGNWSGFEPVRAAILDTPTTRKETYDPNAAAKSASGNTKPTHFPNRIDYASNTVLDVNKIYWDNNGMPTWSYGPDNSNSMQVVLFGNINGVVRNQYEDSAKRTGVMPIGFTNFYNETVSNAAKQKDGIINLKKALIKAGFITGKNIDLVDINNNTVGNRIFQQALITAMVQGTSENQGKIISGVKKINTFQDWLRSAKADPAFTGDTTNNGSPNRRISINTRQFKPEEFDIPIDQLFQQTVGRGATQDELLEFTNMLNKYSKANPEKSVSITSGTTTRTTTTGGVSDQEIASKMRDKAMANPDAENYNKATKYIDYFRQAIASPVQLG
jgi:hypothetical protein